MDGIVGLFSTSYSLPHLPSRTVRRLCNFRWMRRNIRSLFTENKLLLFIFCRTGLVCSVQKVIMNYSRVAGSRIKHDYVKGGIIFEHFLKFLDNPYYIYICICYFLCSGKKWWKEEGMPLLLYCFQQDALRDEHDSRILLDYFELDITFDPKNKRSKE